MRIGLGTTAVVTGAGGGLGRAVANELHRRGARVLVSDVNGAAADETARQIRERGGKAESMACDVTDFAQVEALAQKADDALGGTDLLVNNAGVAAAGPMGTIPLADWEWVMRVNLWGPIYGCHAFVPRMKKARSGHILNVASIAGIASAPMMGPYNVTKAGVIALSETLAAELEKDGIGVTALCPFFFQTNIMGASRQSGTDPKLSGTAEKFMRNNKVQADDVARIALDACVENRLYCMPHRESKVIWGLKRASGEGFRKFVKMLEKRAR